MTASFFKIPDNAPEKGGEGTAFRGGFPERQRAMARTGRNSETELRPVFLRVQARIVPEARGVKSGELRLESEEWRVRMSF